MMQSLLLLFSGQNRPGTVMRESGTAVMESPRQARKARRLSGLSPDVCTKLMKTDKTTCGLAKHGRICPSPQIPPVIRQATK